MRIAALFLTLMGNSASPGDRAVDEAALGSPVSTIVVRFRSGDRAFSAAVRLDLLLSSLSLSEVSPN